VQNYTPPLADHRFNLEVFGYQESVASIEAFADFDLDMFMDILTEYSRFCVAELLPLNQTGDREGLTFDPATASVTTPKGFPAAYKAFVGNGYSSLSQPAEYGGAGGPHTMAVMASEVLLATNKSFSMAPGLTTGLLDALLAHGDDDLKARFAPSLISGEWTGTMCLTEPQAGTDLGLLTTKAVPDGDGYRITGTKTWITFGEHDLTDQIIHLVLARLPDAPEGIKGISVFVVAKLNDDGTSNGVVCGGLEHKMGIHASPTCVVNLDNAKGYLVGKPHKGMRTMFVMMNAARLNVGVEGLALADAAYQASLAFAKDRRQSRSLNPERNDPNADADNILVHPDVRRMLLDVKSTNEALRGLMTWITINNDVAHSSPDEDARQKAGDLVALLTPIIKSYGSERGFQNVSEAMQVMGGAGYTQDWPVEQYLRDVRIALIYEGTNHIQALDLVGRKLSMKGGRLLQTFSAEVQSALGACASKPELAPFAAIMGKHAMKLQQVTMELGGRAMKDHEQIGAAASNYLNFFALVVLGTVWLKQVDYLSGQPDSDFKRGKMQTARYFFEMVMPEAGLFAKLALVGKDPMMDFDVDLL
jgi:alkylation response protein AidB-like acyl-CoA dehydrogenase